MKYSFPKILEILVGEKRPVLATLIDVSGSAPQIPGAAAVFAEIGLVAGTVGGGLLEAEAEEVARGCLRDNRCRLVTFRLDADPGSSEGAICGGEATVLFDPKVGEARPVFESVLKGLKGRESGILLTRVGPPDGEIVDISRIHLSLTERGSMPGGPPSGSPCPSFTAREIKSLLETGEPLLKKEGEAVLFAQAVVPLPRLVIAGAGHIGRAVARLGSFLDFEVTVIDDRPEFAKKENVPEADTVIAGNFEDSIRALAHSPDDYFVVVTRGHRNDAEALRACLGREAAYVGMIGSKAKVALTRSEFLEKGWATVDGWDRIHTPIGIDIGSQTVEEIAVSIAAELVLVRAGRRKKEGS